MSTFQPLHLQKSASLRRCFINLSVLLLACLGNAACSQDRVIPITQDMLDPESLNCKTPCPLRFKNGEALNGNYNIALTHGGTIKGTFRDGYRQGIVEDYTSGNKLRLRAAYCKGQYCGIYESYRYDGEKESTSSYNEEHKLHGVKTIYSGGGSVAETIEYHNGLMHGMRKEYDSDGKVSYESSYAGGKKNGKEIGYYKGTDKVKSVHHYKDDVKEGKFIYYFQTGEIEEEMFFKDGKKNGKNTLYNASGGEVKLWIERYYKEDLRHGPYIEYDLYAAPGTVYKTRYFWNDEEVTKEEFEKRGG
jgi:antitoxin component YwqK of YwqJK toxin-antitoxin module